ncbi:hypothetical protein MNBD_NITROSPINAE02-949 [hydrothermal vent metagenome]|uniref:Uncharacterized protein n=1 Tax=hydrothermal vent metagenome TaxID=652676 RepID=A0A3B1BYB8_9ZZZZ
MKRFRRMAQVTLLAVVVFACSFGAALAGSLEGLEKGKDYGENMMRPAEIKACMIFSKQLDSQKATITALSKKLDKTEDELHTLKAIVKRGLSSNSRREEIAQFESGKRQFAEMKVKYKEDSERYNNILQDYSEDVDRHNSQCKNRKYYEEDYKAVRKMMK